MLWPLPCLWYMRTTTYFSHSCVELVRPLLAILSQSFCFLVKVKSQSLFLHFLTATGHSVVQDGHRYSVQRIKCPLMLQYRILYSSSFSKQIVLFLCLNHKYLYISSEDSQQYRWLVTKTIADDTIEVEKCVNFPVEWNYISKILVCCCCCCCFCV